MVNHVREFVIYNIHLYTFKAKTVFNIAIVVGVSIECLLFVPLPAVPDRNRKSLLLTLFCLCDQVPCLCPLATHSLVTVLKQLR